jgi:hypothetical protein
MRLPAGRHRQLGDQAEIDLYQKMLHEPDAAKQRVLMREFEKRVVVIEAHEFPMLWWYRIIPYRSYVSGWKISPSHYLNQDLSTVWLRQVDRRLENKRLDPPPRAASRLSGLFRKSLAPQCCRPDRRFPLRFAAFRG